MGLVVYTLAAVALVLGLAWALYVAPTPGPLSLATLLAALVPSLSILAVGGLLLAGMGPARVIFRAVRRRRR